MKITVVFLVCVSVLQTFFFYHFVKERSSAAVSVSAPTQQQAPKIAESSNLQYGLLINELKKEMEELKKELRKIPQSVTAPAPPAEAEPATVAIAQVAQPASSTADHFANQNKDDKWYDAAENLLIDALSTLSSGDYMLYEADCRQSLCKMEIGVENLSATTAEELAAIVPWPAYTQLRIDTDVVPARAILYAAREGFNLGGPEP